MSYGKPVKEGMYNPAYEHDSCGIGFVADIKGKKSFDIVKRGLEVLERMTHRGAEGADNKTGDGSGILLQIPHDFYKEEIPALPEAGEYGTGFMFLPPQEKSQEECINLFEKLAEGEGLKVLAWRNVPVDNSDIGDIAKRSEPCIKQVFIGKSGSADINLELKLFVLRKYAERTIRDSSLDGKQYFYMPSLSSKTIVYKGMLTPEQVKGFYGDLSDERVKSAIALVHSRFSTNTFPSWDLAQPFRIIAHNGEINTVKGNRFWMQARESDFYSEILGDDLEKVLPVIEPGKSDSASFDNALEMLVASGRSLPHALMMMVPESWNDKNPIPDDLKKFYEFHSTFMEPWDGPASMVFCDGKIIGGTLDRNGLRPSRYVVTKSGMIVMGSEVGVQTFEPEEVEYKGRLLPGKILLVDTEEGRIIPDSEVKAKIAASKPYTKWVDENRIVLDDMEADNVDVSIEQDKLLKLQHTFGFNREDIDSIMTPMLLTAMEPTGSMGTDTPLAVLSDKPQPLFNYFKQTFAQVTNPAIDPIREELVMSLTSYIGPRKNLLTESAEHCKMIKFFRPIFTNTEVEKIRGSKNPDIKSITLDAVFKNDSSAGVLGAALDRLCREAEEAVDKGFKYIILSDKKIDENTVPMPSLLASAAVHHHLIKIKKRTRAGILIETGEAREVMHFALLFGYGADAVNPYLAFATIKNLKDSKKLDTDLSYEELEENFIKANDKGLLKVLSKMGTSTLRSYRGAQIFETVGLSLESVEKYFTGTCSRLSGIGTDQLALEAIKKHEKGFKENRKLLESEGVYSYRKTGERHSWNPESIYMLQWATRTNDYDKYKKFTSIVNKQVLEPHSIRGLFDFKKMTPVSIDEVEPVEAIMKRLTTGAMSFGSISKEAHESIAIAMNSIHGRSNSGEGGEDPRRFQKNSDGTSSRSAIKQVASGRFGVTSNYLANADEIQIKVSQGAKPGEGGQLPGHKVNKIIAKTRFSTPGVTLISPPPHHDIYSIEDLAQLIFDLKNANPNARISVKLVSESGVGTIASGVAKAYADNILISGYDGGTGASPQSSIKHAGLPWEIGLAETHQTLVKNDLRGRIRLQTDGRLKTGRDVVVAALLGAEEFGFGTGALIVLGCVMMRKCHLNTCPVGVATQDPELRKRFRGRPEYLINYFRFMAQEVREIMAELGITKFSDLIGRTDLLETRKLDHWKAAYLDPKDLLHRPAEADKYANYCVTDQLHKINDVKDLKLIEKIKPLLTPARDTNISVDMNICNTDRSVGAMLSYEVSKAYGEEGLPEDSIRCNFSGNAGQSFGAFLAKGVTFRLEGDSNDYFGKGLSGGKLIVVPPAESSFKAEENIIIGNTVLYGATSGEAYVRGVAGERFCVRNSGALAVVEGTGDHCAEYMTGGRVIVLGKVGRNFAAGMSGGIAYVLDERGDFDYYCNKGMVELTPVKDYDDQEFIIDMLKKHIRYTDSSVAKNIINNWYDYLPKFVKIMPLEFKRAMNEMRIAQIDEKLASICEEEQLKESF